MRYLSSTRAGRLVKAESYVDFAEASSDLWEVIWPEGPI